METRDAGSGAEYLPIADVSIETVRPAPRGFTLEGRGADGADYRFEMDLELPVDRRTKTVLAELLAQSDWRIGRRNSTPLLRRPRRSAPVSS